MLGNTIELELNHINQQIHDTLPYIWQNDQALKGGKTLFDRFTKALCVKFHGLSSERLAVSIRIPQPEERRDFELLVNEFRPLTGEQVVALVEVLRVETRLIVFNGNRELFRFRKDPANWLNKPPRMGWSVITELQDDWSPRLKQTAALTYASDLYQLQTVLRFLQLINRRGQKDQAALDIEGYFDHLS